MLKMSLGVKKSCADAYSICRISGIGIGFWNPGPSTAARFLPYGSLLLIVEYPFTAPPRFGCLLGDADIPGGSAQEIGTYVFS